MPKGRETSPPATKWIGGRLCLDFNNTIDWTGLTPVEDERLTDYDRLVQWSHEADVISHEERRRLLSMAAEHPDVAERALRKARDIRATMHAIFFSVIQGRKPDPKRLQSLNGLLREVPAEVHTTAESAESSFGWGWPAEQNELECMLWPVVWSAAQLLTSPELTRVETCANETCGWLFLDTSRKHNRRWCEMGTCGNRAKARRFYEKRRGR